ncbi:MAG: type II toxin-antitoxin system RelE/ParE family toxin [Anaerolineae bacterium]|jgi:mRNA-degrading endonuclease RelE of RelBE toxin-antitoxin system|nr:type II toxin-antitoxin system RelE/ParE family toxin [Anaerolineae bacterium]
MPSEVIIIPECDKQIKHLKKKYPLITNEIRDLLDVLEADERPGDLIPHIGADVYKVRLANKSAQRGKSGGFRAIYYVQLANKVYIINVYSKTEQSDISTQEIRDILADLLANSDEDDSTSE